MYDGNLSIIPLGSGRGFAELICKHINSILHKEEAPYPVRLTNVTEVFFANQEAKVVIDESIRGKDMYIVQLTDDPHSDKSVNDNIMALASAINATYHADPQRITVVLPQYPYARQDKRKGREAITARLIGALMEMSGATKIITLDIHAEAIVGFFDRLQIENLYIGSILVDYVNNQLADYIDKMMIVAPDAGSAKKGLYYAKRLNMDLAIMDKVRNYSKQAVVESMRLVGDVKGKNVLLIDDMLGTGGTILNACKKLKDNGAKDIFVAVSLPFFSGKSYKKFQKAYEEKLFNRILGTNAVFWGETFVKANPWYVELDVSSLFAQVIYNIHQGKSVSQLLI